MTAEQLRKRLAIALAGQTHAEIGQRLGMSAGFVGMVLSGHRPPSKKFLEAVGVERVILYRSK